MRQLLAALLLLPSLAHGAITPIGTGTADNDINGTSIVPTRHASTAEDDLVVCLVGQKNATDYTTITENGGTYTRLIGLNGTTGSTLTAWAKIMTASESDPQFNFSDTTSGRTTIGQCHTFRGTLDTVTGIVAHSATATGTAQGYLGTPALTVTTDNTVVVVGGIRENMWSTDNPGPLSTMTEIGQPDRTSSATVALKWDYVIQTTAANISADTSTWLSTLNTADYASLAISIEPAATESVPTFSSGPTTSAVDADTVRWTFTSSTSATFRGVLCPKDATAPSVSETKALTCAGGATALGTVSKAVTGADTADADISGGRPVADAYAVLTNGAGDTTLQTSADVCLSAPAGKTLVNCAAGLTSIHANSPINTFNASASPDIAAGDIMVADSTTDVGDDLTWTATGLYSYDGSGARRKFSSTFYDLTAGAMHADTMQVCVNNKTPTAAVESYELVLVKDQPFPAVDFAPMFADLDDPTLTLTSSDVGTGTGADTRPAGTTMTAGVFDDTGSGATSADGSSGSLTVTATDSCGDTVQIPFSWSVYDQVTVPDVVADSLSSAITALQAVNLDVTFESQCDAAISALDVISQSPAASTVVNPFTSVDLVVSSGPCGGRRGRLMLGIGVR